MKNALLGFCAVACLTLLAVACGKNDSGGGGTAAAPTCPVGQYWMAQYNQCVGTATACNGLATTTCQATVGQQCAVGSTYVAQYGTCLPQGICPVGSAQVGQSCVQGQLSGYPTTGYPTTGYPQVGYPTTGYPQVGYPQAGYPTTYPYTGYAPGYGTYQQGYPQYGNTVGAYGYIRLF